MIKQDTEKLQCFTQHHITLLEQPRCPNRQTSTFTRNYTTKISFTQPGSAWQLSDQRWQLLNGYCPKPEQESKKSCYALLYLELSLLWAPQMTRYSTMENLLMDAVLRVLNKIKPAPAFVMPNSISAHDFKSAPLYHFTTRWMFIDISTVLYWGF